MPPRTMGGAKKNPSKGTSEASSSALHIYAVRDSGSESENEVMPSPSKDTEVSDTQPMQPLNLFFKQTEYNKPCKIQTRCYLSKFLEMIEDFKPELEWFRMYHQFQHLFHMAKGPNRKLMGMWMLLLRIICMDRKTVFWFVVNGVPIRYSLREHGLISGLYCHDYPKECYLKMKLDKYINKFKERQFQKKKRITVKDVKEKLLSMKKSFPDRLKMAILYFLSMVIRGKAKVDGYLDPFLLRMTDDPELCKTYPWGQLTFEDFVKDIYHLMDHLKGCVKETLTFPSFIILLEPFECIQNLRRSFREDIEGADKECSRMCKQKFRDSSMKGYPLEEIYGLLDSTKDIQSILVPELEEEYLLVRIIDDEADDEALDMVPDSWNKHLAGKTIWWKDLYDLDVVSREESWFASVF